MKFERKITIYGKDSYIIISILLFLLFVVLSGISASYEKYLLSIPFIICGLISYIAFWYYSKPLENKWIDSELPQNYRVKQ